MRARRRSAYRSMGWVGGGEEEEEEEEEEGGGGRKEEEEEEEEGAWVCMARRFCSCCLGEWVGGWVGGEKEWLDGEL